MLGRYALATQRCQLAVAVPPEVGWKGPAYLRIRGAERCRYSAGGLCYISTCTISLAASCSRPFGQLRDHRFKCSSVKVWGDKFSRGRTWTVHTALFNLREGRDLRFEF